MITDGKLSMELVTLTPDQDGALQWPGLGLIKNGGDYSSPLKCVAIFFISCSVGMTFHPLYVQHP